MQTYTRPIILALFAVLVFTGCAARRLAVVPCDSNNCGKLPR